VEVAVDGDRWRRMSLTTCEVRPTSLLAWKWKLWKSWRVTRLIMNINTVSFCRSVCITRRNVKRALFYCSYYRRIIVIIITIRILHHYRHCSSPRSEVWENPALYEKSSIRPYSQFASTSAFYFARHRVKHGSIIMNNVNAVTKSRIKSIP